MLVSKTFSVVSVGSCKDQSVAYTYQVEVPVISNSECVAKGSELLLEIAPKKTMGERKETWKDDVHKAKKINKVKEMATAKQEKL